MKYKNLLMLSILSTAVLLSACGSDAGNISEENTETEIVASADTETETTEENTEAEKMESAEIADTAVESTEAADAETIVSENTENETETVASGGFTDTYDETRPADEVTYETSDGYDIWQNTEFGNYGDGTVSKDQAYTNWLNYAKENGADKVWGYYWVYLNGSAAGSKKSYMVFMKEGSKHYGEVFQYGDTLLDGSTNNIGTNDEYYAWVHEGAMQQAIDAGIAEFDENGNVTNINLDLLEE